MCLRFCREVMHSRGGSWRVMSLPERVLEGPDTFKIVLAIFLEG